MPVRPLALAALILLSPAPEAAHADEDGPAAAPAAESPAEIPTPAPPAAGEEAGTTDPLPGGGPADSPDPVPDPAGSSAPDAGSTPPDEARPPAPGGRAAPEEVGATADPGTRPARSTDAAEASGLEHTSFVEPLTTVAPRSGSGALLRHEPVLRGHALPGQEVPPGTLTRISLGTVTRVPAQGAASSATDWVVGLSAAGAAAAAVVVAARRSRARRTGS